MLLRQGNRQKTALRETALNETALKEDSAGFVLLSFVVYVFVVVDRSESFGLGGCRALGQALPSVRGGAPPDSFLPGHRTPDSFIPRILPVPCCSHTFCLLLIAAARASACCSITA